MSRLRSLADEPPSAIVTIRDVTETRAGAHREAERTKARALRHLTGGVAHDFNNLLTTVIGNLDLVAEEVRDPERQEALQDMARAVDRGRELTRRLLAYSERQPLQPRTVSLRELLPDILARLRTLSGPRVRLDCSRIESTDALDVSVDAARLEEAIVSLVDNARDASSREDKITIYVDRRRSTTHEDEPARSFVRLVVADRGQGMDDATRKRACDLSTRPEVCPTPAWG